MAVEQVYQLKITLKQSKPPIWRRIQIPSDDTLEDLGEAIMSVFNWNGCNSKRFLAYGEEMDINLTLKHVFGHVKQKINFVYDLGENWDHVVLLEEILPVDPAILYPICLAGRQACPPDGCGGMLGYYHLLEILRNPSHAEFMETLEWIQQNNYEDRFQDNYRFDPKSVL